MVQNKSVEHRDCLISFSIQEARQERVIKFLNHEKTKEEKKCQHKEIMQTGIHS